MISWRRYCIRLWTCTTITASVPLLSTGPNISSFFTPCSELMISIRSRMRAISFFLKDVYNLQDIFANVYNYELLYLVLTLAIIKNILESNYNCLSSETTKNSN